MPAWGAGSFALGGGGIGLVARGQCVDQAVHALGVDLLRELAPVGFHQPDAEHGQGVDLPARGVVRGFFEGVVQLYRVSPANDLGAHQHIFVAGRCAQRFDLYGLLTDMRQRAGVGAHQQELEFFLQPLLLLGRGLAPAGACCGSRHAAEVDMGHHGLVDQRNQRLQIAVAYRLVGLYRIEHRGGQAPDQRIGRFIGGPCRQWQEKSPEKGPGKDPGEGQAKSHRPRETSVHHGHGSHGFGLQGSSGNMPSLDGSSASSSSMSLASAAWLRTCRNTSRVKLYLSSAALSSTEPARNRLARISTVRSRYSDWRAEADSRWCSALPLMSTDSARLSRNVDGPRNGSTRYGPVPTPQCPSVRPKSCLWRSMFSSLAMSSSPPRPRKVLTLTRMKLVAAASPRSCSRLFTNDQMSPMFAKKLLTPVRTGAGVTSR